MVVRSGRPAEERPRLILSIPLRSLSWAARATDPATPTLILHGTRDDSVPIRLSQALRDARPDLVALETFDAGHTLCWNTDPDRWRDTVANWLLAQRIPSRPATPAKTQLKR